MYYPIEKICARFTDVLITINKEDYALAQKKMPAKKVCYVPGVGIDLSKIQNIECDRNEVRKSMGVPEDCVLLLSIGELNVNKNHQVVVKALAKLNNKNVHYAVAGVGDQKGNLLNLAKELGVENQFHLLGYRTDALKLYRAADIFIFPSFREGLSVSMMEAMASGCPIVCSQIRGNVDLVENEKGGYLFNPVDWQALSLNLKKLIDNKLLCEQFGKCNKKNIIPFVK
jgi:glycosyltransferase involved in cell wall biosynthesis